MYPFASDENFVQKMSAIANIIHIAECDTEEELRAICEDKDNQWFCGLRDAIDAIRWVDDAEYPYPIEGKWCGSHREMICSECKKPWNDLMVCDADDTGYWCIDPPYCPNCGAEMRR